MSELTAEQVREAIFNGSSYASYDGAKYYADGINMQAIATELNARYVNSESIVHCKDCEQYSIDRYGKSWCGYVYAAVEPDGFCKWGERDDETE